MSGASHDLSVFQERVALAVKGSKRKLLDMLCTIKPTHVDVRW
jgi:hypothetical protein